MMSRVLSATWLLIATDAALAQSSPPLATPQFLLPIDTTNPDCLRIAAYATTTQVTAEIDATTGTMIRSALAGTTVWWAFQASTRRRLEVVTPRGRRKVLR
jgi:hypothetical protein